MMRTDLNVFRNFTTDQSGGPISFIDKYTDIDGNSINLFIYEDKYEAILPLFTELNNRMNFLYSDEVHDKDKRIERFIELTDKLGISTF